MSEEFAPSPWTVTSNSWQFTTIYDADGYPVARLDLEDWGVTEEGQEDLEKLQAKVARAMTILSWCILAFAAYALVCVPFACWLGRHLRNLNGS